MGKNEEQNDGQLELFRKEFHEFLETYETDMRGDKKINGNRGVVGGVRDIKRDLEEHKKEHEKYPSLTYLLAHKPVKTVAAIIGTFLVLNALLTAGLLQVFGTLFGVPSHIP